MISEISQTEKEKYSVTSLKFRIKKKKLNTDRVEWWLPEAEEWEE